MLNAAEPSPSGRSLSAQFHAAAGAIASWRNTLLLTHTKPDGDALGCLSAMRRILRQRSSESTALLYEPLPARYAVFDPSDFAVLGKDLSLSDLSRFDSAAILDTCTYSQLQPVGDWLRTSPASKLVIDHHRTRDDLADVYVIDESAAAATLIVYELAKAMQWPVDHRTAEALLIGIATDTGWFRHSNTDERVFAAAAELEGSGAEAHRLYEGLYLQESPARVRLLGAALETLQLLAGGKLAVLTLDAAAFTRTGASRSDTEDIINEPLRIASVVVSILVVEQEDGGVRASFRSRTPAVMHGPGTASKVPDIDVARLAQLFGGGGHSRAAGAKLAGPLAVARAKLIDAVLPRLE